MYRLEQKYARRKNRSTFTTGAQYVNGEYVYTSNHTTYSSEASSPVSGGSGAGASGKMMWTPPKGGWSR